GGRHHRDRRGRPPPAPGRARRGTAAPPRRLDAEAAALPPRRLCQVRQPGDVGGHRRRVPPAVVRTGMALRVAYQGEPGAYSDAAAAALFGDVGVQALPCPTFAEVFDALAAGSADAAVVPVENSYAGDVGEVYDLLRRGGVRIVLELDLPIRHCLLALPGAAPEDIRVVRSHPQALGQCREFLRRLGLRAEPAHDTAGAARRLAEEGDRQAAAIASERAARAYGLAGLLRDIQDASDNVTRFHVLVPEDGPAEPPGPPTAPWRTAAGGARRKTSLLL